MKVIGFDLGDGESCVTLLDDSSSVEPRVIPLFGQMSFLSAVGVKDGKVVVGEAASVQSGTEDVKVRFKSRYLMDPAAAADVRAFAQGVAAELLRTEPALMAEAAGTVVGCPAGWGEGRRQQYAALLESAGFVNVSVVPEPRAAFLYVRHARGLRIDPALMQKSALVIDMGSSTTDFAYIVDGHQQNLTMFGDTNLGGGLLDELILARGIEHSADRAELLAVMGKSPAWHSYCELEARRLKEEYFLSEDKGETLTRRLVVCYDKTLVLELSLDKKSIEEIIRMPIPALGGRSFVGCLSDALRTAAKVSAQTPPDVVILTGGASRMTFLQDAVRESFGSSLMVFTPEPECTIARGLAYAGRVDRNLAVFRKEVDSIAHGERLSQAVGGSVHKLYTPIAEVLYNTAEQSTLKAVGLWRGGAVKTIEDLDGIITKEIADAFAGDEAKAQLQGSIRDWLTDLMHTLENELSGLCVRCGVPPEHMKLDGLALTTGVTGVGMSLPDVLGMDVLSGVMTVVFAAIGATVCGGSGLALISTGLVGVLSGIIIGVVVALLGRSEMEQMFRKMNLPVPLRLLVTDSAVRRGMERQKEKIQAEIIRSLADPAGGFAARLTESLGQTLGEQLEKLAKDAEMSITA